MDSHFCFFDNTGVDPHTWHSRFLVQQQAARLR